MQWGGCTEWVMAKDNRDVGPGGLSSSLHFPNSELGTGEWEDTVHGEKRAQPRGDGAWDIRLDHV